VPLGRAGTVLFVEDNLEVAEVGQSYFEQLGYEVRRAASAQEALEFLEHDPRVDVVCSDILMPGVMNGLELALAIRDRFPRLPVILTTGYSSSAQDAVRHGFVVLQKPFTLDSLAASLRDALKWQEGRAQAAQQVG
jgi:two-component system NtrC family sensor kinase